MVEIKHAPRPAIERISHLVSQIQRGDIKIPKFQRGFIWKKNQILTLLESIYEGYPIGSLLFWLTNEKMKSEKEIGGFDLPPTPDVYPRNYVLDGQQRLTSIYGVLNWEDPKQVHILNVYYNLKKKEFYHYNNEDNSKAIPMSILLDTKKIRDFGNSISIFDDFDDLDNELIILLETFKEYLIPVVTIKEKTVEEVSPIFERINSTGTQLSIFDLMVAATWSEGFDLNDSIEDIRDSTKIKDFDNINNSAFLKLMARVQGFGAKRDSIFKLRDLKADDLKSLSNKIKECIERAVDFLATDLNVPSDAFLPYENQLIVIAYFYSNIKSPTHNQLKFLRRWFWQSGFAEHFRGAGDNILEKDFKAIDELISEEKDESLMIRVSLVENDLLKRQFIKNSAFSKTFVVMLANNSPRNISNGEKIDISKALSVFNKKEFHHIYPQDYLKEKGIETKKRNNICNICMLASSQNKIISSKAPNLYLKQYIEKLGESANDVLRSNILPNKNDVDFENYEEFIRERAKLILLEINKLCT
ncbi:hypothetical protein C5S42_00710 [Candidatus Methanomarinus sp.]|nr:hypothetical protein C5S42_00710 [ANME-2 cluster archaeon]